MLRSAIFLRAWFVLPCLAWVLTACGADDTPANGTADTQGAGHWHHARIEGVAGASGLAVLGDTLFVVQSGGKRALHAIDRAELEPDGTVTPRLVRVEVRSEQRVHGLDDLLAARGYEVDKLWEAGIDLQGLAAQRPGRLFIADRSFRVVFRAVLQRGVGGDWSRALVEGAFTVPGAKRLSADRADYRDMTPGLSGLDSTRGRRIDDLVVLERSRYVENDSVPDTFRMLRLDAFGAPVTRRGLGAYMVGRVPDEAPVEAEAIVHEADRYLVLRSSGRGSLAPLSPDAAPRTLELGQPTPAPAIDGAGAWRGMARAEDGTLFLLSDGSPAVLAWRDG